MAVNPGHRGNPLTRPPLHQTTPARDTPVPPRRMGRRVLRHLGIPHHRKLAQEIQNTHLLRCPGITHPPGLWTCLIVTAFIFAPATGTVSLSSQIGYVLKNGTLLPLQGPVDGTPTTSYHIWNGSLWTLLFEALCYALVAGLGILRLLNKWFVLAAFVAALTWSEMLRPGLFSGT